MALTQWLGARAAMLAGLALLVPSLAVLVAPPYVKTTNIGETPP